MKLGPLNHVGVATPSIPDSIAFWRDTMGATTIHEPFDMPAQGVRVCFVDTPNSQIELIEPLGDDSPIHGFLKANPKGAASSLFRGAGHPRGQGGVRGDGQAHPERTADRRARYLDLLRPSPRYGWRTDRDHGNAQGRSLIGCDRIHHSEFDSPYPACFTLT